MFGKRTGGSVSSQVAVTRLASVSVVNEPAKHRTFFRAPTDVNMDDDSDLLKGLEVLRGQMARR